VARRTAGYRRRPRASAPPFRAWGLAIALVALVLAWLGAWVSFGIFVVLWVFYILAVRLTRCRVETKKERAPCRWLVRGLLGTCDWHRGMKRGLPRLVPGGWGAPPKFMWPRDDLSPATTTEDPQPNIRARGADATAPAAQRPAYDWIMLAIEVSGLLIAVTGLTYDFLKG